MLEPISEFTVIKLRISRSRLLSRPPQSLYTEVYYVVELALLFQAQNRVLEQVLSVHDNHIDVRMCLIAHVLSDIESKVLKYVQTVSRKPFGAGGGGTGLLMIIGV